MSVRQENVEIVHPVPREMTAEIQDQLPYMSHTFYRITESMGKQNLCMIPWPNLASMFNLRLSQLPEEFQNIRIPDRDTTKVIRQITAPLTAEKRKKLIANLVITHEAFVKRYKPSSDPVIDMDNLYARLFEHDHGSYVSLIRTLRSK